MTLRKDQSGPAACTHRKTYRRGFRLHPSPRRPEMGSSFAYMGFSDGEPRKFSFSLRSMLAAKAVLYAPAKPVVVFPLKLTVRVRCRHASKDALHGFPLAFLSPPPRNGQVLCLDDFFVIAKHASFLSRFARCFAARAYKTKKVRMLGVSACSVPF